MVTAGVAVTLWVLSRQGASSAAERGRMLYARHCTACHGVDGQGRVRGNATALNRGQKLYESACANCHGWEGRGDLGMGPAVNNADFLAVADDAFLWATIAYGRRDTPMFPSLRGLEGVRQFSEAEIDALVAYLRSWEQP